MFSVDKIFITTRLRGVSRQLSDSRSDFEALANFIEPKSGLNKEIGKYLHKEDGALRRLRQSLCSAFKHRKAGLVTLDKSPSNARFAELLSLCGIPCAKTDVENAKRKLFIPRNCPTTPKVLEALDRLIGIFPNLEVDEILFKPRHEDMLILRSEAPDPFVQQLT